MLRLSIKTEKINLNDNYLYYEFCQNKLKDFKCLLFQTANYTKLQIRYDYLIDNNLIEFHIKDNIPTIQYITTYIINSFRIYKSYTVDGHIDISFNIPDYILLPNANMSITHFLRYIECGNEDIPPYKWISHTWTRFKQNIMTEWKDYKEFHKKLEETK